RWYSAFGGGAGGFCSSLTATLLKSRSTRTPKTGSQAELSESAGAWRHRYAIVPVWGGLSFRSRRRATRFTALSRRSNRRKRLFEVLQRAGLGWAVGRTTPAESSDWPARRILTELASCSAAT